MELLVSEASDSIDVLVGKDRRLSDFKEEEAREERRSLLEKSS